MKIAFFEATKLEQETFKELLPKDELVFIEDYIDEKNITKADGAEIVSVFVNSSVDKTVIDSLPSLKFIATRSTGFDHIDCDYAKTKGIKVSNVPAYGSNTVAEFTFALILGLSRKINDSANHLRTKGYFNVEHLKGFELCGKTLGVVGTGKIGKNVVKIAKGFGMNVVAYDLYPDMPYAKEHAFEYKNLDQVMSEADILTLHTPYTKENHHLINEKNISLLKKDAYIINTARGELIDTDALVMALKNGMVAGAGLDVLEDEKELKEEPGILTGESVNKELASYSILLKDKMLLDMENVIVTPHIAFNTKEAVFNIMKTTAENIKSFASGQVINLVK